MPKSTKTATTRKRRTRIADLKRKEKELTPAEAKKVKGGIIAVLIGRSQKITDGTSN
jgi:hypothetical protein